MVGGRGGADGHSSKLRGGGGGDGSIELRDMILNLVEDGSLNTKEKKVAGRTLSW